VASGRRHPREMGEPEVTAFLSGLAARGVSASTQNQALSAVLFLYEIILGRRLAWMNQLVRAQRPARLPVVLSRDEVARLLARLRGPVWLMASLMYGAGLRLLECAELRVKDINIDRGEVTVRDGKGGKARVTMLPAALKQPLLEHPARVKAQHNADLAAGRGAVALPGALRTKYPAAPREWAWQWTFPATRFYRDLATGERRRHLLHESDKTKNTNHSDVERIRSGPCAHQGRLHPSGVHFAQRGTGGGGARSGFAFGRQGQLGARAVDEATFSIGLAGVPITAVLRSQVVALAHGGASAVTIGNSRHG
jgi:integrase